MSPPSPFFAMDSLSSSYRNKLDHPRWNNRHEDVKRAATSSLHHAELGARSINSRLDKARNFARGKRTFAQDWESRERVAMAIPSLQKSPVVALRHEKKQHDGTKGPPVTYSGSMARSSSFAGDKIRSKHGLKNEMAGKISDKDCKSFSNQPSAMESFEADKAKDLSRSSKEAKLRFRKSSGLSTDEVSWSSRSSANKAHEKGEEVWNSRSSAKEANEKWKPSFSATQEECVLEAPVSFPKIVRRARSKRKRDERCKSQQSSKSTSLDGFVAELEEALLRKHESGVDSGVQSVTDLEDPRDDNRGVDVPFKNNGNEARQDVQLEETSEREEGELEPEDDPIKEQHLKTCIDLGKCAVNKLQPENNPCESGHKSDTLGEACQSKCLDIFKHESMLATDSIFHISAVSNPSNTCQLDGKDSSAGRGDQSHTVAISVTEHVHGHQGGSAAAGKGDRSQEEVGTSCKVTVNSMQEPRLHNGSSCVDDMVPSSTTEMEVDTCHLDASKVAKVPAEPASSAKGFGLEKLSLSFSMQSAEQVTEALKDDSHKSRGHWDVTGNETQSADGLTMQAELNVQNELLSNVEESDELSVYNNKHKKLKVGSLQLSLALPGSSITSTKFLPLDLANPKGLESEKNHQLLRHMQSFSHCQTDTFLDDFTTSLPLSSLIHNPSCSRNCTSREDQELSCSGSRVFQQGLWQTPGGDDRVSADVNRSVTSLFQDRHKRYEGPLLQQASQNGKWHNIDGILSVGGERPKQDRHRKNRTLDRTKGGAPGQGCSSLQGKDHKMMNQAQQQPPKLLENMSERPFLPNRMNMERGKELRGSRSPSIDKIGLHEIAWEPVAVMAQKLQELPDSFLEGLKAMARVLLGSFTKRDEFLALQHTISKRTDLTEQTLLLAHPTQLEILVALRTGTQSFVQQGTKMLTYKSLIDIFLQTRCRNVDCQQTLPANRCECQVCLEKSGFCHECMCMECSKFDSDSNTSYWVGCDVCMHWCHTDCGIRMSHIKPTPLAHGGALEMQYQCLSCGHCMELFGFVKGVFTNFAASWGVETLAKELDCIRRIFHGSEDARGKQLYRTTERMLQKLEANVGAQKSCFA